MKKLARTTVTSEGSLPSVALPGPMDFASSGVTAVRASASHPYPREVPSAASDETAVMEAGRPPRFTTQANLHRHDPSTILAIALLVLLAYLPIVRAEIDRGLEDDTVKVLIAVVFVVGAALLWGRWTTAFWMWR